RLGVVAAQQNVVHIGEVGRSVLAELQHSGHGHYVARGIESKHALGQLVISFAGVGRAYGLVKGRGHTLEDRIGIVDASAFIAGKAEDLLCFADGPSKVGAEVFGIKWLMKMVVGSEHGGGIEE